MLLRKSLVAVTIAVGCCAFVHRDRRVQQLELRPSRPRRGLRPCPREAASDGGLPSPSTRCTRRTTGCTCTRSPRSCTAPTGQVTWSADSTMVGMQVDLERPNEVLIQMLKAGDLVINVKSDRRQVRIGAALRLAGSGVRLADRQRAVQRRHVAPPGCGRVAGKQEPARAGWWQRSGVHELSRRDGDERAVHGRVTYPRADRRLQRRGSAQHHPAGRLPRRRLLRHEHRHLRGLAQLSPVGRHHHGSAEGNHHLPAIAPASEPEGSVNFNAFDMDSGSGDDQGEAVPPDTGTPDATSIDASMDAGVLDASDGATE